MSVVPVARGAGAGVAALFRRFPTREHLIAAVFEDAMDAYVSAVTPALAEPAPWKGFGDFIRTVRGMQAADRG